MNALQSYSSDDESGNEAPTHKTGKSGDPGTNYDEVGMDISEDSDDGAVSHSKQKSSAQGAANASAASGAPQGGSSSASSAADNLKNQNDAKEGQRSSLQERLLGIASGGHRLSQEDRGGSTNRRESRKSPSQNRDNKDVGKSKSKSPKAKSPRPQSPSRSVKSSHKKRSRSKSRERDAGRPSQSNREHSSRSHSNRGDQSGQGHTGRSSRDSRDARRGRDDDRKRRDEERRGRRSRSRSRSRERRRSRSRSRDRRSRSRSRERRRRSRSHERKRPMDIRKAEAQQKLAALKAANPDLTAAELMKRSMEAQVEEVKKQTGITLPSYYNPATMNPMKFAEQERKKKLLWGNKSKSAEGTSLLGAAPPGVPSLYGSLGTSSIGPSGLPPVSAPHPAPRPLGLGMGVMSGHGRGGGGTLGGTPSGIGGGGPPGAAGQASLWASTRFANDKDGKMAEKFRRLMGVKDGNSTGPETSAPPARPAAAAPPPPPPPAQSTNTTKGVDLLKKQETMFTSMERQYEMARLATHTHKGFGLGFTSQSFMPK